jgi:hypothetical protein
MEDPDKPPPSVGAYLEQHYAKEVGELHMHLKRDKSLFYALILAILINVFLTIGLIFHPSRNACHTASVEACKLCASRYYKWTLKQEADTML